MTTPTPLPLVISNPLHKVPPILSQLDTIKLWEAVQDLQAKYNQLVQHLNEQETP